MDKTAKDIEFFKCYSPLQNALRQVPMLDSLFVVWAYYRNISKDLDFKFPRGIESSMEIISPYRTELDVRRLTSEWELEILAREVIINSQSSWYAKETLRKFSYFNKTFQKIRKLNDKVTEIYIDSNYIFQEVNRIIQQQLPWNERHIN